MQDAIPTPLPTLCAIVDADAAARAGWTVVALARAFIDGGARFLQLRAKAMASGQLLDLAGAIVELAGAAGARLIVNDRADIAQLAGADGVHVGQEDLSPSAVRLIVGPDAIVGLSSHTEEQVARAVDEPVSYVAIGPVFGTSTKVTGYDRVGLDMVRAAARQTRARALPLVAIGGITLETASSVIDAGADSVAVISDLSSARDPARRVQEFLVRLRMADG